MRVYSSTSDTDFIAMLRERAIATNASPLVIDKLDAMLGTEDLQAEIEKLGATLVYEQDIPRSTVRFEKSQMDYNFVLVLFDMVLFCLVMAIIYTIVSHYLFL